MLIDLHSHLLPAVDDGAHDLDAALKMARIAVDNGTSVMACTPHFYPGVYDSDGDDIIARVDALQAQLDEAGVPLTLVSGGDLRLEPGLIKRLRTGQALTLNGSRYVLIEPAHQLFTQGMEIFFSDLLAAGFQPVLTHPERMAWIDQRFDAIDRLLKSGVWMQITAGAVTGRFGRRPSYWAERFVCEGMAHIVASDAHDPVRRSPKMWDCYEKVMDWIGKEEADNLFIHRPRLVLDDKNPDLCPIEHITASASKRSKMPLWQALKSLMRG